ncbi:unnamed protein product [Anisakis simplex]|uniref:COX4_pro_2 domain-containing protein n=1 Tax=Anisakis simplex TaxID=6269 RepID=A0A0M3JGN9_ANISI|nr:unnamed protein product [Anisakis simplex]
MVSAVRLSQAAGPCSMDEDPVHSTLEATRVLLQIAKYGIIAIAVIITLCVCICR